MSHLGVQMEGGLAAVCWEGRAGAWGRFGSHRNLGGELFSPKVNLNTVHAVNSSSGMATVWIVPFPFVFDHGGPRFCNAVANQEHGEDDEMEMNGSKATARSAGGGERRLSTLEAQLRLY